jgi:hypothetical protein
LRSWSKHLAWKGLFALAGVALGLALAASPARAADEFEERTLNDYVVNADGSVHVTIASRVTNRDPRSIPPRGGGQYLVYRSWNFVVHSAATNLRARTGRTALTSEMREPGEVSSIANVRFGRDLSYNETIDLILEYDLAGVRGERLLLRPEYSYALAIGQGTQTLVRVTAPAGWKLTLFDRPNCGPADATSPTTYICGGSTTAADYAAGGRCAFGDTPIWDCAITQALNRTSTFRFEAATKTPLPARSSTVPLGGRSLNLRISYFTGDEGWVEHVEDILRRGLPLLETANGYPYPGPATLDIQETGYLDVRGYGSTTFSSQGRISLTPFVDDHTMLAAASFLWSGIFTPRWLGDGMSDYTANIASEVLGVQQMAVPDPLPETPRLDSWTAPTSQALLTTEEQALERAGFARSLQFVNLVAGQVGADRIAAANATLAKNNLRGTARTYLDLLEDSSGVSLAPLFTDWVLADADVKLLPAREAARQHAAALRARAKEAGLTPAPELDAALRAWDFARAERTISAAAAAIDRHEKNLADARAAQLSLGNAFADAFARGAETAGEIAAQEATAIAAVRGASARLQRDGDVLTRLRLLDPDFAALEADARDTLGRGDPQEAARRAAKLEERLDAAAQQAVAQAQKYSSLGIRIGLVGADLTPIAREAEAALDRRDYDRALNLAVDLTDRKDKAEQDGRARATIAGGIAVVLFLVLAGLLARLLRQRLRPRPTPVPSPSGRGLG